MQFTAKELAERLDGLLEGNPDVVVRKLAKIEEADEESVSFIANPKYAVYLNTTKAGVLIVSKDFEASGTYHSVLVRVDDAYTSFTKLLNMFSGSDSKVSGVEPMAFVSQKAKLGKDVFIGNFSYIADDVEIGDNVQIYPNCFIGKGSKIGDNTRVFPNCTLYHDTIVGAHCHIHSGTVIGSDGFGFAPQKDGTFQKINQNGNVIIGDHVDIGANSTIDRATMGSTVIHKGVKIDNLVHIAHNVEIGENTVIAGQTGISGSTKIDKQCVIGGQVGFVGHLYIAPGSQFGAQSGINKSIKTPNKKWNGSPAVEYMDSLRLINHNRNLPEVEKRLRLLEDQLKSLLALKND